MTPTRHSSRGTTTAVRPQLAVHWGERLSCFGLGGRWLQDSVCIPTTHARKGLSFSTTQRPGEEEVGFSRNQHSAGKKGYPASAFSSTQYSRVLLEPLSRRKMERRLPSHFQREIVEPVRRLPTFQDGNCAVSQNGGSRWRLDDFSGSHGCVPSCTNPSRVIQVSSDGSQPDGSVLFPCTSVRTVHRPTSFYKNCRECGSGSSCTRHFCPRVLRRLADQRPGSPETVRQHTEDSGFSLRVGLENQPGEIQPRPLSVVHVPRGTLRHKSEHGQTIRPLAGTDPQDRGNWLSKHDRFN